MSQIRPRLVRQGGQRRGHWSGVVTKALTTGAHRWRFNDHQGGRVEVTESAESRIPFQPAGSSSALGSRNDSHLTDGSRPSTPIIIRRLRFLVSAVMMPARYLCDRDKEQRQRVAAGIARAAQISAKPATGRAPWSSWSTSGPQTNCSDGVGGVPAAQGHQRQPAGRRQTQQRDGGDQAAQHHQRDWGRRRGLTKSASQ